MKTQTLSLRIKQAFMGLVILGVVAFFIVPPLMATDYAVRQGDFQARILSSSSGMGMAGKPVIRARIEDETGRIFWIRMPNTSIVAPDIELVIDVWCETEAFSNCTARYRRAG